MSQTAQLDVRVVETHDSPKLTVDWSSRWSEFLSSIGPALKRSEARLAGEAPFGLIPLRIMLPSYLVEATVILIALISYAKIEQLRPSVAPRLASHDVIYYSGDELPRTEDLGGAEAGTQGSGGGDEMSHHTQTIKVARGGSLVPRVADAPDVKLPSTLGAVANLLAIKPNAGPPPAEGLRSTRSAPNLATPLIAPAPNEIRDYTRNGIQIAPVVAPPPSVTRERPLTAPTLNTTLAAPAPNITNDHSLVAPALAPIVAPPSANVSRDRALVAPTLTPSVAAPTQDIKRDPFRTAPTLANNVVAPAPTAVARQLSPAPVQMMDPAVAPPPVSTPERVNSRASKLSLPAPAVASPPPSTEISADMRRLSSGSVPDPAKTVVPPPTQAASGSFMSSLVGRIFGPSETVAPPPSAVSRGTTGGSAPSLPANVVAPPPATSLEATGNTRGQRSARGATLDAKVVAPPPSTGVTGGTGVSRASAPYLGNPTVVPPPPSLAGAGGGTGNTGGGAGSPSGTLANNVVPPPPSVSGGANSVGAGLGRKGPGLATPFDSGSAITPSNNNGSGNSGAIVSSQPGSKIGAPPKTDIGSLSLSPAGGDKPGLGDTGSGTAIARGGGSGSALNGTGTGAAKTDTGHGADLNARSGISPTTGPGGAGTVPSGTPAVRGVDVSGGSGVVTLPSFGDDPTANDPNKSLGRSATRQRSKNLDVTVVATAGSGGAFEPYKNLLHGEVYTTYFETLLGTVVMEFADQSQPTRGFGSSLTAPAPLRTDLAQGLPHTRMVITCTVDASGNIKNPRVLEAGPAVMTAKILAALPSWKFQPAMRNNQPVEVTAILGFGINTNDRF